MNQNVCRLYFYDCRVLVNAQGESTSCDDINSKKDIDYSRGVQDVCLKISQEALV